MFRNAQFRRIARRWRVDIEAFGRVQFETRPFVESSSTHGGVQVAGDGSELSHQIEAQERAFGSLASGTHVGHAVRSHG